VRARVATSGIAPPVGSAAGAIPPSNGTVGARHVEVGAQHLEAAINTRQHHGGLPRSLGARDKGLHR